MHLGPIKLLYYYSNPAKTSPNESQSVPMRVLVGAVRLGTTLLRLNPKKAQVCR